MKIFVACVLLSLAACSGNNPPNTNPPPTNPPPTGPKEPKGNECARYWPNPCP